MKSVSTIDLIISYKVRLGFVNERVYKWRARKDRCEMRAITYSRQSISIQMSRDRPRPPAWR